MSTTLGQPSWYAYFDLSQDPTNPRYDFTNSILGTVNGVFSAGGCFGALFVAWACDSLGRRTSILFASPVAIVGGALQGGAVHIAMFLVGRLLSGFAVDECVLCCSTVSALSFSRYLPSSQTRHVGRVGAAVPVRSGATSDPWISRRPTWYVVTAAVTCFPYAHLLTHPAGVILVLGYVLAAWIGVACYFSSNPHFQWRFPLCFQSL